VVESGCARAIGDRKQRRDVAILHFSGSGQLNGFQFREGRATPSELIATTEWFYAGGTVYDEWMAVTLRLVDASRFDRADVVCLSDGEVSVSPALEGEWNRRRLARGMRCYSVLLGDDTGATALARVSDALVTLADLTDDERVDAVAERVLGAAMRLGYRPKVHDRLQVALCEALLENNSPRLENLTPERFDGLRRDRNPRDVRGWFVLGQTLFGLGLFPQPPRTLQRGTIWQGASDEDRVAGEWLDWCIRWRSTSTSSPRTRRSYHRTLCLAGRWLAETRVGARAT